MRDLLFKNLTSDNKKRKIILSSETSVKEGLRSRIERHFIWIIKEVPGQGIQAKPQSALYVLREKNNLGCSQKFVCRIKGGLYTVFNGRIFLIMYMQTLKIQLQDLTQLQSK